jgi:hypothetical protein
LPYESQGEIQPLISLKFDALLQEEASAVYSRNNRATWRSYADSACAFDVNDVPVGPSNRPVITDCLLVGSTLRCLASLRFGLRLKAGQFRRRRKERSFAKTRQGATPRAARMLLFPRSFCKFWKSRSGNFDSQAESPGFDPRHSLKSRQKQKSRGGRPNSAKAHFKIAAALALGAVVVCLSGIRPGCF